MLVREVPARGNNDGNMSRVSGRDIRRRVRLVVLHRVPSRVFSKCNRILVVHLVCCWQIWPTIGCCLLLYVMTSGNVL
jgi:hypothetical protein